MELGGIYGMQPSSGQRPKSGMNVSMTKQETNFLYELLRFAVTVLLLGLIILWVRGGEPTLTLNTPASTSAADHQ